MANEVSIRVTMHDDTAAAREKLKAGLATDGMGAGNEFGTKFRESVGKQAPATAPVEARNPIDDAWRSQVQASIRDVARDALKIPVSPETESFRRDLATTLQQVQKDSTQKITAHLDQPDEFRTEVETIVKGLAEEVKAKIPVEADEQSAQDAGRKAGNGFVSGIFQQRPLIATAIVGGLLAGGPLVTAAGEGMGVGLLVSLGVALQKGNPAVDMAWHQLTTNAVAAGQNASAGMVGPIVAGLGQISEAAQRDAPAFQQLFSSAGADIPILVQGLDTLVSNALPGFTAAMAGSQPVAQGVADIMGKLGTAASLIGGAMASSGSAAHTALTALGTAVDGVGHALATLVQFSTQLTSGALPVLVQGFNALLGAAGAILQALSPIAPALGQIAAVGGEAFGAFKLAGLAETGITSLGKSLSSLSTGLTGVGAKMLDSSMSSTKVGSAMATAAGGAATLAGGLGKAAEAAAGPLGIGLGVVSMAMMLFGQSSDEAAQKAQHQAELTKSLASALEQSHGVIDGNVQANVAQSLATDDNVKTLTKYGVTISDVAQKVLQGNGAIDKTIATLEAQKNAVGGSAAAMQAAAGRTGLANEASQQQSSALQKQIDAWKALEASMPDAVKQQQAYEDAVKASASAMGIHIDKASASQMALANLDSTLTSSANLYLQQTSAIKTYVDASVAAAGVNVTAEGSFRQLDQAVTTARESLASAANGVASAQHSLVDASFAVDNARHSEQQAVLAVTQAQFQYQQSLVAEQHAQQAVADARQAAAQQLEQLKRQVIDQADTVDAAKLRLLQAQEAVDKAGLHGQTLAGLGDPTAANQTQYQLLLDLQTAQHGLNDAQATANDLNAQNNAAQKAGIDGAQGVIQAEEQLVSAKNAVTQAAQGVSNAQYAEQQASHAVSDALWSQQQAAFAVTQAQQSETNAQIALNKAEDDASRSLDLNTAAGQRNWATVEDMWNKNYAVTGSIQDATTATETETTKLGFNRDAVQHVIDILNGLSGKNFDFSVTGTPTLDLGPLKGVLEDKSLGLFTSTIGGGSSGGIASAGRLAGGGPVNGAGGPRDDANLIWASAGEYMQSADAHAYYGTEFMDAINKKLLPRYADGGAISPTDLGGLMAMNAGAATAWGLYATAGRTANALGARPQVSVAMPPAGNFSAGAFAGLGSLGGLSSVPGVPSSQAANEAIVRNIWAGYGWDQGAEWAATVRLLMQESGFNNVAQNPTSTAYGMFQFLDSTWAGYGVPKTSDPRLQTIAGGRYLKSRYGDPLGAWAHEQAFNWYAAGGPASGLIGVGDCGPELIKVPNGSTVVSNADSRSVLAGATAAPEIKVTLDVRGTNSGLATLIMNMMRTGEIQILSQYIHQ